MLRTPFLVFSLQGRRGVRCSHYAGEEGLSCKVFDDLKSWHGRQKHLTNIEALIVLCSVLKRRELEHERSVGKNTRRSSNQWQRVLYANFISIGNNMISSAIRCYIIALSRLR